SDAVKADEPKRAAFPRAVACPDPERRTLRQSLQKRHGVVFECGNLSIGGPVPTEQGRRLIFDLGIKSRLIARRIATELKRELDALRPTADRQTARPAFSGLSRLQDGRHPQAIV